MDDNAPYCIQSTIGAWTPWYLWDYGEVFGVQIRERGDYYYREIFYGNTGVIHVGTGSPNLPPSVVITSPSEGETFTEPATLTFSADATDPENGAINVEFYTNATWAATAYAAPFSTQLENLPAGDYALSVIARDAGGLTAMSSVNISVQPLNPPAIVLSAPNLVAGQFQFEASGLSPGKECVVETSLALGDSANWLPIQTNSVTAATMPFSLPAAGGTQFFRVRQLP